MVVNVIEVVTTWWITQDLSNYLPVLVSKLPVSFLPIAQQVRDTNLLGQVTNAWNHFVQTGQIWALLVGIILGYFIRGMGVTR